MNVPDDCQAWEWIDAAGGVHEFTEAEGVIPGRYSGAAMPPTRRVDTAVPGRAGVHRVAATYGPKPWALAVTFTGEAEQGVEEAIAAWASRFNVTLGEGTMRRTRADGVTKRILFCDYDAGMGIDQASGIWSEGAQQAVLTFYAADPFWYDDEAMVESFTTEATAAFFPIPNPDTGSYMTIVESGVFASATVDNDGDVEAYPMWTISGPGESIVLTNHSTGQVLDLTADAGLVLADGDVLTIATRPGETTVELADGTNVAEYLTDPSRLWSLVKGQNVVEVAMSGADEDSAVSFSYRRGWLAP